MVSNIRHHFVIRSGVGEVKKADGRLESVAGNGPKNEGRVRILIMRSSSATPWEANGSTRAAEIPTKN